MQITVIECVHRFNQANVVIEFVWSSLTAGVIPDSPTGETAIALMKR